MIEKKSRRDLVITTTKSIISSISQKLETSASKAKLAELRNSLGRPLDQSLSAIQIVFERMPEEFAGYGDKLSWEEQAIVTTVQLYAVLQQANGQSVDFNGRDNAWNNIGDSFSALRTIDASASTDHRFNAMITSQSFEELVIHLRHLIKLLKSKSKESKINFSMLAGDLYSFLSGYEDSVRLNWSRAYYSQRQTNEDKGE